MTISKIFLFAMLSLFIQTNANTAFSNGWRQLPYGECTEQGLTPSLTSAIVYDLNDPNTGTIFTPDMCGFDTFASNKYLPKEYLDGYWLYPGQDVYNGWHVADNFESSSCNITTKSATNSSFDCAQSCGTCYRISGPDGARNYIVVSVAEAQYMGNTARGLSGIVEPSYLDSVGSSGDDMEWKRVPCTMDKTGVDNNGGIYIRYRNPFYSHNDTYDHLYFWISNHMIEIKAVYVRYGQGATDRTWYRLPRTVYNEFRYSGWSEGPIQWQHKLGDIFGDSNAQDFDFKIVSVFDEEIFCIALKIKQGVEYDFMECLNANQTPSQFTNLGVYSQQQYDLSCRDTISPTTTAPTTLTSVSPTITTGNSTTSFIGTTTAPTTNAPTTDTAASITIDQSTDHAAVTITTPTIDTAPTTPSPAPTINPIDNASSLSMTLIIVIAVCSIVVIVAISCLICMKILSHEVQEVKTLKIATMKQIKAHTVPAASPMSHEIERDLDRAVTADSMYEPADIEIAGDITNNGVNIDDIVIDLDRIVSNESMYNNNDKQQSIDIKTGGDTTNANNRNTKYVIQWSTKDLLDWIIKLENGRYAQFKDQLYARFNDEKVNGKNIHDIDEQDLRYYGIKFLSDRKAMMKHIETLINSALYEPQQEGETVDTGDDI